MQFLIKQQSGFVSYTKKYTWALTPPTEINCCYFCGGKFFISINPKHNDTMASHSRQAQYEQELETLISCYPLTPTENSKKFQQGYIEQLSSTATLSEIGVTLYSPIEDRIIYSQLRHQKQLMHVPVCVPLLKNRLHINRLTHPDDLEFWARTIMEYCKMIMEHTTGQFATVLYGSRRLLEKDNEYHSYIHCIAPAYEKNKIYPSLLIITSKRVNVDNFPQFRYFTNPPDNYHEEHPFSTRFQQVQLRPREEELMQLLCAGESRKQIQKLMGISSNTIEDHYKSIRQKTAIRNIRIIAELWKIVKQLMMFAIAVTDDQLLAITIC